MEKYSIILMDEIKKSIQNCWVRLQVGKYWQALRTYGAIIAMTDLYEKEIDELPDDINNEVWELHSQVTKIECKVENDD